MRFENSTMQAAARYIRFALVTLFLGFAPAATAEEMNPSINDWPEIRPSEKLAAGPGCAWQPGFSVEGSSGTIKAMTIFDDGDGSALYIGGYFATINGKSLGYIAKWDGLQWVSVGGGMDNDVETLAVHVDDDGQAALYAGGRFTVAGGVNAARVAKWDGEVWAPLGSGMNNDVRALEAHDGALYAGGLFTTAGGGSANRIAKWDGTQWTSLGTGMNNYVFALEAHNDGNGSALYAGGVFTNAGGVSVKRAAKWDGNSWTALGGGMNHNIHDLQTFNDGNGPGLYAAGVFWLADGESARRIAKWNGSQWEALGTGLNNNAYALAVYNDGNGDALYAGGLFTSAGDESADRIAKWDGSQWSTLGLGMDRYVDTLLAYEDEHGPVLYAGGVFTTAGSLQANNIAKWNGTNWTNRGLGVGGLDGSINAMVVHNDGSGPALYIGGDFTTAGGVAASNIAKWDGTQWQPLSNGIGGAVNALAVYDSELYAAGSFTTASGISASRIAKWNGTTWSQVGEGVNNVVEALAVYDDGNGPALYAGGTFTSAGENSANRVAKWDGSTWAPLGDGVDNWVLALAVYETNNEEALYAGGYFTTADGQPAQRIARWNGTEWSPLSTGMNDIVLTLAAVDNGADQILFAGGQFTTAGGLNSSRVAQWDDQSWDRLVAGVDNTVRALKIYNDGYGDALYVGGDFSFADGSSANRIAQWDGEVWTNLGAGLDNNVNALVAYDDGSGSALYTGGSFTTAGGLSSAGLAKWGCPPVSDADIAVTKSNGVNWLVAGGMTEYTVTVTNATAFDAPTVTFTDAFPPELTCSWTSTATGGATGANQGSGSVIQDSLNLPANSSVVYTVPCAVDALPTEEITNSASALSPGDPNSSNNTGSDTDTVVAGGDADLEVILSHGVQEVFAGGTVTYTLDVRNYGPDNDPEAQLHLDLPPEINECGWRATPDGGVTGSTSTGGPSFYQTLAMPPGSSVRYTVTCNIPATMEAPLLTIATVNGSFDPLPANNFADDEASILRPVLETLILTSYSRMRSKLALTDGDFGRLQRRLNDFAKHSSVQGAIVDIGYGADLIELYNLWDADVSGGGSNPTLANFVLLGCYPPYLGECGPERRGLHDLLREKLAEHPSVEYLMIIGDDRIIPMARVRDFTDLPAEFDYTNGDRGYIPGITAENTTVGQALSQIDPELFLSDDPLAVNRRLSVQKLQQHRATLLPDLAIGRLVETPNEIIQSLNVYLGQGGLLDVSRSDRRVMVTGYDFLIDSGKRIRNRWKNALDAPLDPDDLFPVDGQLISQTWGEPDVEQRRETLLNHLEGTAQVGPGQGSYGILSLNGHANHYEIGVPSLAVTDIQGLGTNQLSDLDINGAVVYSVGCHAGLPVAGLNATIKDNPEDLPQVLLRQGAAVYAANSGFGWGLLHGVGYSERLVEIFTEELSRGGDVKIGDAVRRTKKRYYQGTTPFDRYDAKTLLQWTLFGFPMYSVRPGITPDQEDLESAVTVASETRDNTPQYMIAVQKGFDFTAPGVFTKYKANGDITEDDGCVTLPGEPEGCYYALNGQTTSTADLPLEPMFIEDSRLDGTNQRGVLWMGGRYVEEEQWTPLIGQLISNGGELSTRPPLPSTTLLKPRPRSSRGSTSPSECPLADTDFNSVVFTTAELLFDDNSQPTIHRRHLEVNLEVLYYNNLENPGDNCDTLAPELPTSDNPPHTVVGNTVFWNVPVSDQAGVWRVVVVYDDEIQNRWIPIELQDNGDGTWTGQKDIPVEMSGLTYFLQAVDNRGNVSWVDFESTPLNSSGIERDLPAPLKAVRTGTVIADLAASLNGPESVLNNGTITFDMEVENLGPGLALTPSVQLDLGGADYLAASPEMGWSCQPTAGTVNCTGTALEALTTSSISIFADAPDTGGLLTATMTTTLATDSNNTNNQATTDVLVIDHTMTDLAIDLAAGALVEGGPIDYSITVTNRGPNPVYGGRVTDIFPQELENITWTCSHSAGSFCSPNGEDSISDNVDILPGGALIYTIEAFIVDGTSGPIINTATVELSPEMTDYDRSNNVAQVTVRRNLFSDGFESGDSTAWSAVIGRR